MNTKNLFQKTLALENTGRPPVWFMRQAGRYHSHYQNLKKKYSFIELCKNPNAAVETAMGPIEDFDFDAAILFSDLLFPLEVMGMGLKYDPGPKLDWYLKDAAAVTRLRAGVELASELSFQGEALRLTRARLSPEKGLLGFVGGPLTLFFYAVSGSHQGDLSDARSAMQPGGKDSRWDSFLEKLLPILAENLVIQARSGADTIAILDTCAGEIPVAEYKSRVVPALSALLDRYAARMKQLGLPLIPIGYYSKSTGDEHWHSIEKLPISYLGIDWNHPIPRVLENWSHRWAIQGNFDPHEMLLPKSELEPKIRAFFEGPLRLPAQHRRGWVCGLGHGVLQTTPEENVRLFLRLQKEYFQ